MDIKATIEFENLGTIGQPGWNGEVFRGFDSQLGAELAFKRIKKTNFRDVAEFFSEAKSIHASRHANVAEVKYAAQTTDDIWLAMPFYEKGSLQQVIESRCLTIGEVVKFAIAFLTGLQNVHKKGFLHLDIKPANLLLTDQGDVVLADFGCARELDVNFLADPIAAYPLHQVPERFKAHKLGIEADIYQAGLTLYRLCNGDGLFYQPLGGHKTAAEIGEQKVRDKINKKIKGGSYPDRQLFLPHVPQRMRKVIRKALSVDPDGRFKTAAEMIEALSDVHRCLECEYDSDGNKHRWTIDKGEVSYQIEASPAFQFGKDAPAQAVTVSTTKTIKANGNVQRVVRHCNKFATPPEASVAISRIAEELDSN